MVRKIADRETRGLLLECVNNIHEAIKDRLFDVETFDCKEDANHVSLDVTFKGHEIIRIVTDLATPD